MPAMKAADVSDAVHDFLTGRRNPALFAGAGVGVRAGLPSWAGLIDHLASVADAYDPLTGQLIRKRAQDGHFLSAAVVYKSCPDIPAGEKYHQLAMPFYAPPESARLRSLLSLPFSAIFTTNYDRSMHDAYAANFARSPLTVELGDSTMKNAPYITDFYIARIHGRAEVPGSLVLDEDDYRRTEQDEFYLDLLRHAFTRYSCLFVGFSFIDPAINRVLQVIEERLAPNFPAFHTALLPTDADARLVARLAALNIEVLHYDPADEHGALWTGISRASREFTASEKEDRPRAVPPIGAIQPFLATSYARAKMGQELQPLRDTVVEGMILGILAQSHQAVTIDALSTELQKVLGLPQDQVSLIAKRRVTALHQRGWCMMDGDRVTSIAVGGKALQDDLQVLVEGVSNRLLVREQLSVTAEVKPQIEGAIEDALLVRGWDLGAHFAGADTSELFDLYGTVTAIVDRRCFQLSERQRRAITLACCDMFNRPDKEESRVLADLGRVAFGLQLILNSPCATTAQHAILPDLIYLDSNVLMPVIIEGHPFRPAYLDTLQRLSDSATAVGSKIDIVVGRVFLSEVIAHKQIARRDVEALGLEDPNELADHILYYGAETTNVFVGAYASWVGRQKTPITFGEFLREAAPYNTETELAGYIAKQGFQTIDLRPHSSHEADIFSDVETALQNAYDGDERSRFDPKQGVLIEHEGKQLAQLAVDTAQRKRSLFVTADARLRRLAAGPVLGGAGSATISHIGLVQLIDMLLGIRGDPTSFGRLLWGGSGTDEGTRVLNYYTNQALRFYDEAMAMTMPAVLEGCVSETTRAAARLGIVLQPGSTTENKARTARFLDRFEDRFFANMADAIRKSNPEKYASVLEARRSRLTEHLGKTARLIEQHEQRLAEALDPAECRYHEAELVELREDLQGYQAAIAQLQTNERG